MPQTLHVAVPMKLASASQHVLLQQELICNGFGPFSKKLTVWNIMRTGNGRQMRQLARQRMWSLVLQCLVYADDGRGT